MEISSLEITKAMSTLPTISQIRLTTESESSLTSLSYQTGLFPPSLKILVEAPF